jgi:nucleotide-binding universal stress UspA family protein
MFSKILVALDHSETAVVVFNQALELAKATDAHLMLLHILSTDDQDAPEMPTTFPSMYYYPGLSATSIEMYQKQWETYKQTASDILTAQVEAAQLAGVTVQATQQEGSPGQTICEFAKNWEADLILLGSRGRAGLSEWLLGSVSNHVMHHAPCSVLVSRAADSRHSNPSVPDHLNHQLISNLGGWQ